MGHRRRIECPDGIFHVTGRGNAQQTIFEDEIDYAEFLRLVATALARFGWRCLSFCLLPNHYHLLLETPEPNLGVGMLFLNGTYARRFNSRHQRVGHVFQGPYRAQLVGRDSHLLELYRYIALNPVRARLCDHPAGWPWSSYPGLAGSGEPHSFLDIRAVTDLFGPPAALEAFVADVRQQPGCNQVAA